MAEFRLLLQEIFNDFFQEAGCCLLQKKGQERRRNPLVSGPSKCDIPAHAPRHCTARGPTAGASTTTASGPFILSWYPTQNPFLISTLELVRTSSLCLPPSLNTPIYAPHVNLCGCASHSPVTAVLRPHKLMPSAFSLFAFIPLSICSWHEGARFFSGAPALHRKEQPVPCQDTPVSPESLILCPITQQHPLVATINAQFLQIKYTVTSSHLPPFKPCNDAT